jgi:hypothetical protein
MPPRTSPAGDPPTSTTHGTTPQRPAAPAALKVAGAAAPHAPARSGRRPPRPGRGYASVQRLSPLTMYPLRELCRSRASPRRARVRSPLSIVCAPTSHARPDRTSVRRVGGSTRPLRTPSPGHAMARMTEADRFLEIGERVIGPTWRVDSLFAGGRPRPAGSSRSSKHASARARPSSSASRFLAGVGRSKPSRQHAVPCRQATSASPSVRHAGGRMPARTPAAVLPRSARALGVAPVTP